MWEGGIVPNKVSHSFSPTPHKTTAATTAKTTCHKNCLDVNRFCRNFLKAATENSKNTKLRPEVEVMAPSATTERNLCLPCCYVCVSVSVSVRRLFKWVFISCRFAFSRCCRASSFSVFRSPFSVYLPPT